MGCPTTFMRRLKARSCQSSTIAMLAGCHTRGSRGAQFSIWRIGRQHDTCGLVVNDLLRQSETGLVDESPELSGAGGICFPVGYVAVYLLHQRRGRTCRSTDAQGYSVRRPRLPACQP